MQLLILYFDINRAQDNYEIIKKIGRGKYSEVYEGINTQTNQRIVIKILKPGKLSISSIFVFPLLAVYLIASKLILCPLHRSQEEQDQKRD